MSIKNRETVIILSLDLLLSLFSFWFARYFGGLPRWYWLALSAVLWVIVGALSGKLKYKDYKRIRYACIGITAVDVICTVILYWTYRKFVPGYEYDYSIILAGILLITCEIVLYLFIRRIYYRKIPFLYEEQNRSGYAEKGVGKPLDLKKEVWNQDMPVLMEKIRTCDNTTDVIDDFRNTFQSNRTIITDTLSPDSCLNIGTQFPTFIVLSNSLNGATHLNQLLSHVNESLPNGGYIACHCQTIRLRKQWLMSQNPIGVNHLITALDSFWHNIIGRFILTKHLYNQITHSRKKSIHRVELLGRIYRAGFEIVCEGVCGGGLYVIASKTSAPISNEKPNTGRLIRLRRIGKDGKEIGVYKFRTMYAYSEYLQPYIYQQEGLYKGYKFANDYRITPFGHFMRRFWLDELPMLINWMKGEMKLVGIRPLSSHYFGLYSTELQQLRIKTKPGLFPPFYADMPETLEEKQNSEIHYLKSYFQSPIATDWKYFWAIVANIVFRNTRSE